MSSLTGDSAPTPGTAPETTAASLLRGGVWTTSSHVVPQLYALLVSVAAARFLGPEDFGRQSLIAFVEISLIMLLASALTLSVVRFIGESIGAGRPETVRRLVAWSWRIQALAAAVGAGTLTGAALLGADPHSAWVLAGVACAAGILHSVPSSLLVGAQRWRDASIVALITGAFATVATVLVLAADGGITGMFVVEAVVSTLNLLWTAALARRTLSKLSSTEPVRDLTGPSWPELRAQAWRYAALTSYGVVLSLVVWRRSEFFFLDHYSTDTQIALYSIAFAVVAALVQIPYSIGLVAFPAVATLAGAGENERIREGFERALRLLLLAALPVTAAGLAFGPELLRFIYGEEFADAVPVFLILFAPFPLMPLLQLSRHVLTGLGRLRFPLAAETAAAALDIGLAFALIPRHGAIGAGVANAAAQIAAGLLIVGYALRQVGPVRWRPQSLVRTAAGSAGAAFAGWVAIALVEGPLGLAVGVAVAVPVFVALAVALRILPAEDAAWLDRMAGSRFGGSVGWLCRRCA